MSDILGWHFLKTVGFRIKAVAFDWSSFSDQCDEPLGSLRTGWLSTQ